MTVIPMPRPLPRPGDKVLVWVYPPGRPRQVWCRVIDVRGPDEFFPVVVRLPHGARGAYQQHEIHGSAAPLWRRLRRG